MKYTINGFSQSKAIEYGLTSDDLLILRWFVDFMGTNRMTFMLGKEEIYYWVDYNKLLEDLPILNVSKERIKKKHFNKLCEVGILKHQHIKTGGSFSYYALGDNYLALLIEDDTPRSKMTEGTSKTTDPYVKNDRTNINLLDNKENINNINIINTKGKFKKPTLEEVKAYCEERKNNIDPQIFIDFYESKGWKVGKTPMKDWKACVRTWEGKNKDRRPQVIKLNSGILPKWYTDRAEVEPISEEEEKEIEDILAEFR